MLNSIKNRLILLYTCSTGLILTTVLILVLINSQEQLEKNQKDGFLNNYITISQKIQMDSEISNLWLSEMELKNHLIIHIEDNGNPLLFEGAWKAPTPRETLIQITKDLALMDNINTNIRPISTNEVKSRIYSIEGNQKDRYLGEILIVPVENGHRSVVLLQYISD